ncbi:MAG: type II toxin-antitoxin system RelB/DinJ family antitoxin [Helicobacter sp.]|nr:type II toxin-antitoxin system RelB/DinJ family antitoxin [Helicobacter sp.]
MSNSVNVNVTFKMNKQEKQEFEAIVQSLGLNLSTAFNIFAKAVIRENAIPFELKATPKIITYASDEEVREVGNKMLEKYKVAFEALAK